MQAVLQANGTFQHPWKGENLKKLNTLQWVSSDLYSPPAIVKQACLYKLVNGEKNI